MTLYRWCILLFALSAAAQPRQVAITIDDLPRGGDTRTGRDLASIRAMTAKLLAPLRGIPVIGFVNAGRDEALGDAGLQSILKLWLDHGATLGNHTWSHPDLNTTSLTDFEADLLRGEPAVAKARHATRVFRHPFLHAGKDAATRTAWRKFLTDHSYRIAPVTLDDSGWMFAAVYAPALKNDPALAALCSRRISRLHGIHLRLLRRAGREVVGRDFPQTLLIHASQLNADAMPDLLAMMRRRGIASSAWKTP